MGGDAQEGSSGKGAVRDQSSSSKPRRLTVFSGFVSYDQLEQKLLGDQKKGPRWLHRNVEGSHPVRMRGPGVYCVSFALCGCAVYAAPIFISVGWQFSILIVAMCTSKRWHHGWQHTGNMLTIERR